jgi:hypothetical protein
VTIVYNSNYIETMPFSDTATQIACTVDSAQMWTVPGVDTDQYQAYFEYASNSNVFVCKNSVPVIPAGGSVGTQPYNEFKPVKRYVRGGDVLHFITPDTTTYIGVSLRKLQGS